jgi:type VI protein secretion system component VasK
MNIDVYLQVAFWFFLTIMACKIVVIAYAEYPRRQMHSLGEDVISLLLTIGFFVWICLLQAKIL